MSFTVLHFAASGGHAKALKILLQHENLKQIINHPDEKVSFKISIIIDTILAPKSGAYLRGATVARMNATQNQNCYHYNNAFANYSMLYYINEGLSHFSC